MSKDGEYIYVQNLIAYIEQVCFALVSNSCSEDLGLLLTSSIYKSRYFSIQQIYTLKTPLHSPKINLSILACLELQVIVTGGKQSQLLVFWTWLGLEFDKSQLESFRQPNELKTVEKSCP